MGVGERGGELGGRRGMWGNESWCMSGPCADHQEEVATGSPAIFTGTSPTICPQNAGTRKLYLSCSTSAHMQVAHVLRMIWVLHLERKTTLLPSPVPASLSSPLRLWSMGVCASASG